MGKIITTATIYS